MLLRSLTFQTIRAEICQSARPGQAASGSTAVAVAVAGAQPERQQRV